MSPWFKQIVAVCLVVVVLGFFGFRVGHPHSGLSTALGSASSSIVVYKSTKDLAVGEKYFGASDVPNLSPVLGEVSDAGADYFTLKNGKFLERVSKDQTKGKLIVVIPFLGYLLGAVGL